MNSIPSKNLKSQLSVSRWNLSEINADIRQKIFAANCGSDYLRLFLNPESFMSVKWYDKNSFSENANEVVSKSDASDKTPAEFTENKSELEAETRNGAKKANRRCLSLVDMIGPKECGRTKCAGRESTENYSARAVGLKKRVKKIQEEWGSACCVMARQISNFGGRDYSVIWMPDFTRRLISSSTCSERTFNECLYDGSPCRAYLDFDFEIFGYENKQHWRNLLNRVNKALTALCISFCCFMLSSEAFCDRRCAECFQKKQCSRCEALENISWSVLDSSDCKKISKHVIFKIKNDRFLFEDKRHLACFVAEWKATVDILRSAAFCEEPLRKKFKSSVKSEDSAPAATDEESVWNRARADSNSDRYLLGKFLDSLDLTVYSGVREFRMMESVKFGDKRPLLLEKVTTIDLLQEFFEKHKNSLVNPVGDVLRTFNGSSGEYPFLKQKIYGYFPSPENKFRCNMHISKRDVYSSSSKLYFPDARAIANGPMEENSTDDMVFDDDDEPKKTEKENKSGRLFDAGDAPKSQTIFKDVSPVSVFEFWNKTLAESLRVLDDSEANFYNSNDFIKLFSDTLVTPCYYESGTDICDLDSCTLISHSNFSEYDDKNKKTGQMSDRLKTMNRIGAISEKMKINGDAMPPICDRKNEGLLVESLELPTFEKLCFDQNLAMDRLKSVPIFFPLANIICQKKRRIFSKQFDVSQEYGDKKVAEVLWDLICLQHFGDDVTGEKLIGDISEEISSKTGAKNSGCFVRYKKEVLENGMHYLIFSGHEKYKKCCLKFERCGSRNQYHKNNNVYFVVRMNDSVYYQKCHSYECQTFFLKHKAKAANFSETNSNEIRRKARGPLVQLSPDFRSRITSFLNVKNCLDAIPAILDDLDAVVK